MSQIDFTDLLKKTVFLALGFKRFGNTRKATGITVNPNFSGSVIEDEKPVVEEKRFKHNKQLLESPELAAILKADTALLAWLDKGRCLDYDLGIRFAPILRVEEIEARLKAYDEVERPALVEEFLAVYMTQRAEAETALGPKHFNPAHYPTLEVMRTKFAFAYHFVTFDTPEKLKEISTALFEAEKAKNQTLVEQAGQGIRDLQLLTLQELTAGLADKLIPSLDGKTKRLHKSNVEAIQEFLGGFDLNNVTGYDELQTKVEEMKGFMIGVDVEKLRESDNLKADLTAKLQEVNASMLEMIQETGRKFR